MIQIWWHEKCNTLDILLPDGVIYTFSEDLPYWDELGIENFSHNDVHGWTKIGEL